MDRLICYHFELQYLEILMISIKNEKQFGFAISGITLSVFDQESHNIDGIFELGRIQPACKDT